MLRAFSSWLRKSFTTGRKSTQRPARTRSRGYRLELESLEERSLLTASSITTATSVALDAYIADALATTTAAEYYLVMPDSGYTGSQPMEILYNSGGGNNAMLQELSPSDAEPISYSLATQFTATGNLQSVTLPGDIYLDSTVTSYEAMPCCDCGTFAPEPWYTVGAPENLEPWLAVDPWVIDPWAPPPGDFVEPWTEVDTWAIDPWAPLPEDFFITPDPWATDPWGGYVDPWAPIDPWMGDYVDPWADPWMDGYVDPWAPIDPWMGDYVDPWAGYVDPIDPWGWGGYVDPIDPWGGYVDPWMPTDPWGGYVDPWMPTDPWGGYVDPWMPIDPWGGYVDSWMPIDPWGGYVDSWMPPPSVTPEPWAGAGPAGGFFSGGSFDQAGGSILPGSGASSFVPEAHLAASVELPSAVFSSAALDGANRLSDGGSVLPGHATGNVAAEVRFTVGEGHEKLVRGTVTGEAAGKADPRLTDPSRVEIANPWDLHVTNEGDNVPVVIGLSTDNLTVISSGEPDQDSDLSPLDSSLLALVPYLSLSTSEKIDLGQTGPAANQEADVTRAIATVFSPAADDVAADELSLFDPSLRGVVHDVARSLYETGSGALSEMQRWLEAPRGDQLQSIEKNVLPMSMQPAVEEQYGAEACLIGSLASILLVSGTQPGGATGRADDRRWKKNEE